MSAAVQGDDSTPVWEDRLQELIEEARGMGIPRSALQYVFHVIVCLAVLDHVFSFPHTTAPCNI